MRRIKILLLTSRKLLKPDTRVLGDTPFSPFGDPEVEDWIELLSANNMPFDIKYHDELSVDTIRCNNAINYSTIILAMPGRELTKENISVLIQASDDFGISLIASYNRLHRKILHLFGIVKIQSRRIRFPCSAIIDTTQFNDPRIEREIVLGDGYKIDFERWGFWRNPSRYLKKHFKRLWEQVWLYMKVKISPKATPLAFVKGTLDPAIVKYTNGKAANYYVAFHSDFYLDRFTSLHRIMREFLRDNSGWGMAEFNLENTMVLRMDDPGICEKVYLKGYIFRNLIKEDWRGIIEVLKSHKAMLSVMYTPCWVDDANYDNGRLFVNAREIKTREKGAIYDSKNVIFVKTNHTNHPLRFDYTAEFLALRELAHTGQVDIESHGLIHLEGNLNRWLHAKDRYTNPAWYISEFRHVFDNRARSGIEQKKVLQESAKLINDFFSLSPSTVTPSGHEQSIDSERIAHDIGYKLFSSDINSILKDDVVIRNDKIKSIFFEITKATHCFSESGYPVVGVFHDYDIIKRGIDWLKGILKSWQEARIQRFITLRELASYLCSSIEVYLDEEKMHIEVDISKTGAVLNTPTSRYFSHNEMKICIQIPKEKKPRDIEIDKEPWGNYVCNHALNQITLSLPPFGLHEKQHITIALA